VGETSRFRRPIAYDPLPSQLAFHQLDTLYKGFSGPVGSGKSMAFVQEALRLAYVNRGCTGLIGAPTYTLLADSTRQAFLDILEENAVPHTFRKQANLVLLHEPNARVLFRSLDQPERLRAMNLAWFGIDELTYAKPDSWTRLQGRLRSPKAVERRGFAAWTPKGFDWVYKRFIAGEGPKAELFSAIRAKPRENRYVPPDYYDSLLTYDERFYKQEAEGEYLNVQSGAVYFTFDRQAHIKPLTFDPRFPLIWTLDFNIDPLCSVLLQEIDTTTETERRVGKTSRVFHAIGEIALKDARTTHAVDAFVKRVRPWVDDGKLKQIYLHGDPAGAAGHTSSPDSDWNIVRRELRQKLPNVDVLFQVSRKHPEVKVRVAAVCGQLRDVEGRVGLYLDPGCKELAADFDELVWKTDTHGVPFDEIDKRDKKRTHVSDALGYAIERRRRPPGGHQSSDLI
jgi:hypothetical protein